MTPLEPNYSGVGGLNSRSNLPSEICTDKKIFLVSGNPLEMVELGHDGVALTPELEDEIVEEAKKMIKEEYWLFTGEKKEEIVKWVFQKLKEALK